VTTNAEIIVAFGRVIDSYMARLGCTRYEALIHARNRRRAATTRGVYNITRLERVIWPTAKSLGRVSPGG
jgi:hypothetical protein